MDHLHFFFGFWICSYTRLKLFSKPMAAVNFICVGMIEMKVIQCSMLIAHHFSSEMTLPSRRKKQSWPKDWYVQQVQFVFSRLMCLNATWKHTISNLFASMVVLELFYNNFRCHSLHLLQATIELKLTYGPWV